MANGAPIIRAGASLDAISKRVARVNQLPIFFEDWEDAFIDYSKWYSVIASSGTIDGSRSGGQAGLQAQATLSTGATNGGSVFLATRKHVVSHKNGQAIDLSFVTKTVLEWQAVFTSVADIENASFTMGFGSMADSGAGFTATRTVDNMLGFELVSDVLRAYSDSGATETTSVLTTAPTLSNLNLYRIELNRINGARFFVNNVLQATISTNITTIRSFAINFYIKNDNAANTILRLGNIRVYAEDVE